MNPITVGFHMTKGPTAFYVESSLHFASTGDLSLGFRIVYRLVFRYPRGISANPNALAQEGREAFMGVFGLDHDHVHIEEPSVSGSNSDEGSIVFWEAYWDKGDLDLRKIQKCNWTLNVIAKRHQVAIQQISTTIMVRDLSYLQSVEIGLRK